MLGQSRVVIKLADAVTTVSAQPSVSMYGRDVEMSSVQATVSGTGAVSATVYVEVSNDGIGWIRDPDSNLQPSGTGIASAGLTLSVPWQFLRANVTAVSGTGAQVTVTLGG